MDDDVLKQAMSPIIEGKKVAAELPAGVVRNDPVTRQHEELCPLL